jgi:hypothetical protein
MAGPNGSSSGVAPPATKLQRGNARGGKKLAGQEHAEAKRAKWDPLSEARSSLGSGGVRN